MPVFFRQLKASLPLSLIDRWVTLGLALIFIGLPLSRAALSIGVILISVSIFFPGRSLRNLPIWLWAGIAFWGMHLLGMAYTSNQAFGWEDIWQKLPILTAPIALFRASKLPARTVRGLLWLLVITCSLAIVWMLAMAVFHSLTNGMSLALLRDCAFGDCQNQDLWKNSIKWMSYSLLAEGISQHPTYLSMVLQAGFLAIVWLWEDARLRGAHVPQWVMGSITGLIFLSIALLSSRTQQGIFVLVLASLAIFLLWGRMSWKQFLVPVGAVLLLFLGTQFSTPKTRQRVSEVVERQKTAPEHVDDWTGISVRKEVWRSGWNLAQKYPLTGVGTGDFRDSLTAQYQRDDFQYGFKRGLDPHNQYLATTLALGGVGLVLLLLWFGSQLITAIRTKRWPWFMWVAMVGLACVTETFLGRQIGVALLGVISPFLAFHLPVAGIVPGGGKESMPSEVLADRASAG